MHRRLNIIAGAMLGMSVLLAGCGDTIDKYTPPASSTIFVGTGGSDVTAPTVLSTSPTSSATGVTTGTNISVIFSEPMASGSIIAGSTFVVTYGGTPVSGAVTLTGGTTHGHQRSCR